MRNLILGVFLLFSLALTNISYAGCCSYGCCDCSCVAAHLAAAKKLGIETFTTDSIECKKGQEKKHKHGHRSHSHALPLKGKVHKH